MVLGVNFLRTLGPILWDFDDLCMDFWHSGKRVLWKGIGSTRWDIPSTSTLHALSKDNRPAPSAVRPSRYPQLQKDELMLQQEYAKKRYDAKQRPLNFAVGDWVWLRTLHRPMQSLLPGRQEHAENSAQAMLVPSKYFNELVTSLIDYNYLMARSRRLHHPCFHYSTAVSPKRQNVCCVPSSALVYGTSSSNGLDSLMRTQRGSP